MNTLLRIGLIPGNAFCVVIDPTGQQPARVEFDADAQPGSDGRSRLGAALARHTSVRHSGGELQVCIGDSVVARIRAGALTEHRPLTAFGGRFLAENGVPLAAGPLQASAAESRSAGGLLQTDLHSHFAGCLSGHDLVDLGLAVDAMVAKEVLAQAGIFCEHDMPLSALDDAARARFACALDIPLDRQVTFLDMERLYAMRAPLTRHPALFAPQLWRIAQRASEAGVSYLELSLSSILEPTLLAQAHTVLPAIEAQLGVGIRFLVALSRHDDLEWDLDVLRRVEACLGSRAIVGIDFMGHETNSTRAFLPHLEAAAALARQRAGWVVRVHAGENPAFPENVRESVAALRPLVQDHGLELRIGHGLYGVDDATLSDLAALSSSLRPDGGRAVFEFNLTSNLALNNIRTTFDVPLRRVIAAGVDVVLGTDGQGLYRTHVQDEAQAARATGLGDEAIGQIATTERRLLARKRTAQELLPAWSDFVMPPLTPPLHYTDAVAKRKRAHADAVTEALQAHLRALSLPLFDATGLRAHLAQRPVLNLAGAWRNSYAQFNKHDIARLTSFFQALLKGVGQLGGVILTGGTHDGVEGLLHRCAHCMQPPCAEVIALVSAQVPLDGLDAQGLSGIHVISNTLYDKAAPLYALVQECRGLALFVGGGVIVGDEIQAARNLGLHYCLLADLPGASAKAAQMDPAHAISLLQPELAAQQVLNLLATGPRREQLFHPGANDAVDIVVLRHTAEVQTEPELLLVRRHDAAPAENGRFAIPGGFVLPGESLPAAAMRELVEETGLRITQDALQAVGVVEGNGRDPRDTDERWVRSHLFVVRINANDYGNTTLVAGTDTSRAFFVPLSRRPQCLAFDHDQLLAMALKQG
ncbi:MAG: NUDIX domain-containing protein [Pseudomonadota bacterium]